MEIGKCSNKKTSSCPAFLIDGLDSILIFDTNMLIDISVNQTNKYVLTIYLAQFYLWPQTKIGISYTTLQPLATYTVNCFDDLHQAFSIYIINIMVTLLSHTMSLIVKYMLMIIYHSDSNNPIMMIIQLDTLSNQSWWSFTVMVAKIPLFMIIFVSRTFLTSISLRTVARNG